MHVAMVCLKLLMNENWLATIIQSFENTLTLNKMKYFSNGLQRVLPLNKIDGVYILISTSIYQLKVTREHPSEN